MTFRPRNLTRAGLAVGAVVVLSMAIPMPSRAAAECLGKPVTISARGGTVTGTAGDDVILGSSKTERIVGGGGHDTICAGPGDDVIMGEGGADTVDGGEGKDRLAGGPDDDVLIGRDGADRLDGDEGNDVLDGREGDDRISGGPGDDVLEGRDGEDRLNGDAGTDVLRGWDGEDRMIGGDGDDELSGGAANDELQGGSGQDTLLGGNDGDRLRGGGGDDTLRGERGDDRIEGGPDVDDCDGGAGSNRLRECETGPGQQGVASVTVNAPAGVPANVRLTGPVDTLVTKGTSGTTTTGRLTLPSGRYRVDVPPVTFEGVRYVGDASRSQIDVTPGQENVVVVGYSPDGGAEGLHATGVDSSGINLAWTAPSGVDFSLRRAPGQLPARSLNDGVAVPTVGMTAADRDLPAGSTFAYSLFTRVSGVWQGPLVIRAGTAPAPDEEGAAYVAPPSTLLAERADITSVAANGTDVRIVLADGMAPPLVGAAVVLPASTELPGGFLGLVLSLSPDGRTAVLKPGSLDDAFDFYEVNVSELTGETIPLEPIASEIVPTEMQSARSARSRAVSDGPGPAASSIGDCLGGNAGATINFDPSIALGGHFNAKLDTYNVLGANLPKGASLDMRLAATIRAAVDVEANIALTCSIGFKPVFFKIPAGPVPMQFYFSPTAQVYVGGGVKISQAGHVLTAGLEFSGSMGITGGASFSGGPFFNSTPLTPTVVRNGAVGVKLGGQIIVGPGAGSAGKGVIAGVSGEFNPLDASLGGVFPLGHPKYNGCVEAKAAANYLIGVTAKAWLGNWDISTTLTIPGLNGSYHYPGSPWYLPTGCKTAVEPEPAGDLLGKGVVKVSDGTTGAPKQWGHVDGFAPGAKTWVLSTGVMSDAVGTPDVDASTELGGSGDDALSALAGHRTEDAAAYQVTLVPADSTLHVKYVFASEEYPEFVGSAFNDVMAVFVNGRNCATVPGTQTPVAINTINDRTNASLYVDNSQGANGYSTTMDGLTVPLTCSVPVTPGQPTTVKIAVADSSDGALDSAVALLDDGIWAD